MLQRYTEKSSTIFHTTSMLHCMRMHDHICLKIIIYVTEHERILIRSDVSIDLGTVFWLSKTQYYTQDLNSCINILVPVPNFIKKPRSVFFFTVDNNFFYMIPADKTQQNASFIPLYITKRTLIEFFVYATVINFRSLWLTMFYFYFFRKRGGGMNTTSLFISGL